MAGGACLDKGDRGCGFRPGLLIATVAALTVAGGAYRLTARYLDRARSAPVRLPLALARIPRQVGFWQGREVPIPVRIQKVAGNDDFMSRVYENRRTGQQADVYVAFTGEPRTMLGHRPRVCYPASGWVHDETKEGTIKTASGRQVPCLIHRFHMPGDDSVDRVILNYYVVNGRLTTDHRTFSGLSWRTPSLGGQVARYVAQVQIGSATESAVRAAGTDLTDVILEFLPDESGMVHAAGTAVNEPANVSSTAP